MLHKMGHHSILRINRNTNGLPRRLIKQIQPGHNEYCQLDIEIPESNRSIPANVTWCGAGGRNTILSTLKGRNIMGKFRVKQVKNGKPILITLVPPHALYKMYSNAADVANARTQYTGIHRKHLTRYFKIRLHDYFFSVIVSQLNILLNRFMFLRNNRVGKPHATRRTCQLLTQPLGNMLYKGHHYVVSCSYYIENAPLLKAWGEKHNYTYLFPPTKKHCPVKKHCINCGNTQSRPTAVRICLPCSVGLEGDALAYVCTKCELLYHCEWDLTNASYTNNTM